MASTVLGPGGNPRGNPGGNPGGPEGGPGPHWRSLSSSKQLFLLPPSSLRPPFSSSLLGVCVLLQNNLPDPAKHCWKFLIRGYAQIKFLI